MAGGVGDGPAVLTDGGSMRLDVASRPEEVATARHAVASFLMERGVLSTFAEDVQLVTSELVTNAIIHGRSGPIAVELELDEEIRLRVTNHGSVRTIPPVEDWSVADPGARSGRGLGIVRRLSDEVDVVGDDSRSTIAVRRRLPDGGGAR